MRETLTFPFFSPNNKGQGGSDGCHKAAETAVWLITVYHDRTGFSAGRAFGTAFVPQG
jgi:hypothetical protein